MNGKLSCRDGVYGGWEKAVEYLPKIGVKYIETAFRPMDEIQKVAEGAAKHGVSILTLAGGVDLDKPDQVAKVIDAARAAQKVGVKHIFLSAHGKAERRVCITKLREIGQAAGECGVTICLETHPPFCHNAAEMLKTMADISHPNVRINFDTANIYYYNKNLNSAVELEHVVPFVASLHLKDTDGGFKSGKFPVLGEGVVDFPRIFKCLKDANFDGPLTMELEGELMAGLNLDQRNQKVAACVNYLKKIGAV